jgi:hypothetical protein
LTAALASAAFVISTIARWASFSGASSTMTEEETLRSVQPGGSEKVAPALV